MQDGGGYCVIFIMGSRAGDGRAAGMGFVLKNFPICFISHQGLGDLSYFKYNFVLGRLKAHHRNVLLV